MSTLVKTYKLDQFISLFSKAGLIKVKIIRDGVEKDCFVETLEVKYTTCEKKEDVGTSTV